MFSLDSLVKYSLFFQKKMICHLANGTFLKREENFKNWILFKKCFLEDNNKLKNPVQVGKKWGKGTENIVYWMKS